MQTEPMVNIIEQLYQGFSGYTIPSYPTGCPCCLSVVEHQQLQQQPIRQLTPHDLWRYSFRALTTRGDDHQFRAVLPRLLELLALDPACLMIEMVFSKLAYADWQTWPAQEQQLIQAYLETLWNQSLCEPEYPLDRLLCAIAQTGSELRPLLVAWDAAMHRLPGLQHYANFLQANMTTIISKNYLANVCWEGRSQAVATVLAWVRDAARRQWLNQTFVESHDAAETQVLATILKWDDLFPL